MSIQLRHAQGSWGTFALQAGHRQCFVRTKLPSGTDVGPIHIVAKPKAINWMEASRALPCDVLVGPVWVEHSSAPQSGF